MNRDINYLQHINEAITRINSYVAVGKDTFCKETHWQDATIHQLEIIGEATKKLSDAFRNNNPTVPWKHPLLLSLALLLIAGCTQRTDPTPYMDLSVPITALKPVGKIGYTDHKDIGVGVIAGRHNNSCVVSIHKRYGMVVSAVLVIKHDNKKLVRAVLGEHLIDDMYVFEFALADEMLQGAYILVHMKQGNTFATYRADMANFPIKGPSSQ
jgi:hypothetical protein